MSDCQPFYILLFCLIASKNLFTVTSFLNILPFFTTFHSLPCLPSSFIYYCQCSLGRPGNEEYVSFMVSLCRFGSFEIFKVRDIVTGRVGPSVGRVDILHQLLDHTTKSFFPEVCWQFFVCPSIVCLYFGWRVSLAYLSVCQSVCVSAYLSSPASMYVCMTRSFSVYQ